MKKVFSVWRKNAPVWIAAAGTLGILAVVVVLFAPQPPVEPVLSQASARCFLLDLPPGADDPFFRWLDEHDPALLVRSDARQSVVRHLMRHKRPEAAKPVWVRPEIRAYAVPPPEPEILPVTDVRVPPPEVNVRRKVLIHKPVEESYPRLRIGGKYEKLSLPESDMAGARSNLSIWFSSTGGKVRYRIVQSSGDAELDLRMVRELLLRRDPPQGAVELEWREK
ncbi:MAG: hypothetical protein IJC73_08690 [Lentisphaeria bacterium]|nr:hypothetical protein [Lentisphaeria bacterium]